jgi:hypothetical protein
LKELAEQFDLHVNQIKQWPDQAMERSAFGWCRTLTLVRGLAQNQRRLFWM